MDRIMEQLRAYRPWNEQEEADCAELLRRLGQGEDLWTRENRSAHLTASGWIVSPERDRVLMAYHNLYDSWSWLGGHATATMIFWLSLCGRHRRRAGFPLCAPSARSCSPWRSCLWTGTKSAGTMCRHTCT